MVRVVSSSLACGRGWDSGRKGRKGRDGAGGRGELTATPGGLTTIAMKSSSNTICFNLAVGGGGGGERGGEGGEARAAVQGAVV